jgi:hypothetical protein
VARHEPHLASMCCDFQFISMLFCVEVRAREAPHLARTSRASSHRAHAPHAAAMHDCTNGPAGLDRRHIIRRSPQKRPKAGGLTPSSVYRQAMPTSTWTVLLTVLFQVSHAKLMRRRPVSADMIGAGSSSAAIIELTQSVCMYRLRL